MYTYIYTYIPTHMYKYIHMYLSVSLSLYIYVHTYIECVHMCIWIYTCTSTYKSIMNVVFVFINLRICTVERIELDKIEIGHDFRRYTVDAGQFINVRLFVSLSLFQYLVLMCVTRTQTQTHTKINMHICTYMYI